MPLSPSQRWSSAVQDIFACARGRLPATFLERKLADVGLPGLKPLPNADLPRFEKAIDLVNALVDGRPAPGGKRPDEAMLAAFPDDHPTLGGLRVLAQEYISFMRPSKKAKAQPAAPAPVAVPERREERRDDRRGGFDRRDDRRDDRRGGPDRRDERRDRPAPAALPPRPPRIAWEAWLAKHLREAKQDKSEQVAAPAPAPAAEAAPVVAADGAAAAPAPAPVAPAPAPAAAEVFIPAALVSWQIDGEAKRQLARIRDRVIAVVKEQTAGNDPAAAIREVAFAVLRPPMAVRDDLRGLILEHLQQHQVQLSMAALYPPPPVAALKRDWENLLQQRGPEDPAVQAAWKKLLDAHPEAKAKLEHERSQELEDLFKRFAAAAREQGEEGEDARGLRARIESRFAGQAERFNAELAQVRAAAEAVATAGKLVAERTWADPEVLAAIAALEPAGRERLLAQRKHELDELDRRFRGALKEHGPDGEAAQAALARLQARFPAEGASAAERIARIKRGDDLAKQERERRDGGRSLSTVHLGSAEHRITRLKPVAAWRLVVAVTGGKSRGNGHAVGLLLSGASAPGPVAADWRAAASSNLDELDGAIQAVADRDGGVLGLSLGDCPERGAGWTDGIVGLAALTALVLPVDGATTLSIELPAWAELPDAAALDSALAALAGRGITITRAGAPADHTASLAEAVAWTWGGRREAETARIRQSGLAGSCLLEASAALRDTLAALAGGTLPAWSAWGALLAESESDAGGIAEALVARIAERVATDHEAGAALFKHLNGLARGRIADAPRLVRELAWLERHVGAQLRPRDRLRLTGAQIAAQAAAGAIDAGAADALVARLAELREDWPAEVLEAALHAASHAREALDFERADAFLAAWAKADALACGGRAMFVRLAEERARIAAAAGRWKDARKQIDKGDESAARMADAGERVAVQSRLSQLRASVLSDDPSVDAEEARNALIAALQVAEPVHAAGELATAGSHGRRFAHHTLLRWAVRRRDDVLVGAYLARREQWCEVKEQPAAHILALRAVVLAPTDAAGALAALTEAGERQGGESAPTAQRLSLAACAVACALLGAAPPELRERLTALRRERPAATPAVTALERALGLAPDFAAGLAEALPLLAR